MTHPIPVAVIGGYLGSGKTTLVNNLLRNAGGKRLAIMVNEFGELPIDEELIEASGDEIISLAGGCVCCSYGSDLIDAMRRLSRLHPAPDNVLLETSGVALPGSIAGTISLLPEFQLDGIVVLADAETVRNLAGDKFMSDTIERQLADADIVLLNKTDLVSESSLEDLLDWLPGLAPNARIIKTRRSLVPPSVVLQNFVQNARDIPDGPFQHDIQFETEQLKVDDCIDAYAFAESLIASRPRLVRAKGFVREASGSIKTVQIVGQRYEVSNASNDVATGLVVISVRA